MTLLAVYTRPELALLATDTFVETCGTVPGVAPDDWPLVTTGTASKLEWCRAGWFAGTGVGPWIDAIAPVLRGVRTFDEAPRALREAGGALMADWEVQAPELAAHVRADRTHWFLLGANGATARVLNWEGAAAFTVPHGRAAGSWPPSVIPSRRQVLLNEYNSRLRRADLDHAVRATATYLGAVVAACGPAGGVSDELEMALLVAEAGAWRPYYLPRTPWRDVASGAIGAQLVGPDGPDRTIMRREPRACA